MQRVERINLSKLKKCNQFWEDMTPTEKGRICEKCKNIIVDFRNLKANEIAEIHTFSDKVICGIYKDEQLKIIKPNNKIRTLKSLYLGLIGLISPITILSQNNGDITKIEQNERSFDSNKKTTPRKVNTQSILKDSTRIYGKIVDENNDALISANVYLKNTKIGNTSDFDGNYLIKIPKDSIKNNIITLVFSYIGYKNKEIQISEENTTDGQLKLNISLTEDNVSMFYVSEREKLPLHKRIWNRIKNLFKS